MNTEIISVKAREILDSRGNPTVETCVLLADGSIGSAAVPSGASTGKFEAVELRDGDTGRYGGKGVLKAVENVNGEIAAALKGMDAHQQRQLDRCMCALDATANKARLGANAILSVSLAAAKAAAASAALPLYRYIGGAACGDLPVPMMNILNGGEHADNNVDIQEFMIMPLNATSFSQGLERCVKVYRHLKKALQDSGIPTGGVGDEGGYAPRLENDEQALELIERGIISAGFTPGVDFGIALDAAVSGWKTEEGYEKPKQRAKLSGQELIKQWQDYRKKYPIISIEDGAGEEDWPLWQQLTESMGKSVQLVGDDLFVTNAARLSKGIEMGAANAILIKPNQIGTLTETLDTIEMAQRAGYRTIISHRSGETADTTIADLAVAVNAGQIKTGAPTRTDRVAKYNRLLQIEQQLNER